MVSQTFGAAFALIHGLLYASLAVCLGACSFAFLSLKEENKRGIKKCSHSHSHR